MKCRRNRVRLYQRKWPVSPATMLRSGANTSLAPRSAAPSAVQVPQAALPPTSKTPEDAFGDTGNSKAAVNQKPTPLKRLNARVLSVSPFRQGLFRLSLDNGQIWETTQADSAVDFKPSNSITIIRMTLGNYLISLTDQARTVSVKRIQ